MAFLREGVTPVVGPLGIMHLQGIAGATLAVVLILWKVGRSSMLQQRSLRKKNA